MVLQGIFSGFLSFALLLTVVIAVMPATIYISELIVDNRAFPDELGNLPSWVELTNPSTTVAVNLSSWSLVLTANSINTTWHFPSAANILPLQRGLVFASGRITLPQTLAWPFHANFILPSYASVTLASSAGSVASLSWANSMQLPNISFGVLSSDLTQNRYFLIPTPGAPNDESANSLRLGVMPVPIFSATRGFYTAPVLLFLLSSDPLAIIRFTFDYSTPSNSAGVVYDGSVLNRTSTTTIRVTSCRSGYICSPIATHSYLFLADILQQKSVVGFPTSATMYSVDGPKPAGRDFTLWTDPNLAANETAAKLTTALMQLPTLMITSDMKNVFGSNGFWDSVSNVIQPADLEFIYPSQNLDPLQGQCGIRGLSVPHLKRSLQMEFGGSYWNATMSSNVFDSNATNAVSDLQLNDGKLFQLQSPDFSNWASLLNNNTITYLMDRLTARQQVGASAQLSRRGEWHHTYINGVYFGIYDLVQTIDSSFSEAAFGLTEEGPAVWSVTSLWNTSVLSHIPIVLANLSALLVPSQSSDLTVAYTAAGLSLNLSAFCDHMLLQFRTGLAAYAIPQAVAVSRVDRDYARVMLLDDATLAYTARLPSGYASLEPNGDNAGSIISPYVPSIYRSSSGFNSTAPWLAQLWQSLLRLPSFQLLLSDRIQAMLVDSNSAPWTDNATHAIWQQLTQTLQPGIDAESARWNDRRLNWTAALENGLSASLSTAALLQLLRAERWVSTLPVPQYQVSLQTILSHLSLLTLSAGDSSNSVFEPTTSTSTSLKALSILVFTLDGSDPRSAKNDSLRSTAWLYDPTVAIRVSVADAIAQTVALTGTTSSTIMAITLSARAFQPAQGDVTSVGNWSALTRSQYTLDPAAAFVTSPLLLRFNTSRSTLSPDVDINGQPIYSELITVLISPASRLPFTFTMSYATTDAASLALLLFESLSSSLVVVSQLPASRLVAVSFPVGSSSVGILVSSIAPLPATVTLTLIRLP